ncbi:MAG: 23S rRNA methyltransferase [Maricaulis sp.]|jgi:23S rRNA (uridine2552-2'-O)-methyltransferase|nr:23S rRNA methyltransferase [Maricaulis sp.]HAQ34136.1 23S rRNA methyltransferase [Alphaproteobacteria bacterium]|tara:strand:- start:674 stop:1435 length:762 start_codon:yes stop_codon:yes gene_type:complete
MSDDPSDETGKETGPSGTPEEEPRRRRRKMSAKGGDPRAQKQFHTKVKTARKRSNSSARWLQRQLNDPYVVKAKQDGYRSRAAYKLSELDDRFKIIPRGGSVVDLGAAPGGWVQVCLERGVKRIVGLDLLEIEQIPGAELIVLDFTEPDAPEKVKAMMGGPVDAVFSDLAPWTTGHKSTDHLRIVALVELAAHFALETLKPGGNFAAKVFQGGTEDSLLAELKPRFEKVRHAKPPSSRSDSAETFLLAMGFKG